MSEVIIGVKNDIVYVKMNIKNSRDVIAIFSKMSTLWHDMRRLSDNFSEPEDYEALEKKE